MKPISLIPNLYFIGAGGIGMSNLIRYFLAQGKSVAGYDKVESPLTQQLNNEGAPIHYKEDINLVPDLFKDKNNTLVVYTPAVPQDNAELAFFRQNDFTLMKRAQLLGEITRIQRGLCVAGTHGKTTTSSMIAHLLRQSHLDCNAFLGGILKNYNTNLLLSTTSDLTVIEADEYDRSFHHLAPYMAVITSVAPDHLDIYKTEKAYRQAFIHFTSLIRPSGALLLEHHVDIHPALQPHVRLLRYAGNLSNQTPDSFPNGETRHSSLSTPSPSQKPRLAPLLTLNSYLLTPPPPLPDFYAANVRTANGEIIFDFITPQSIIKDIPLGVPVEINIVNAVAALAIAWLNGLSDHELRSGMASFQGSRRRFDFHIKTPSTVLIDDYAHHPEELEASITSVRKLFPTRRLTVAFQPHLFTRTRDFYPQFAAALSLADEVILLPIYPARELPLPGITSEIILNLVTAPSKTLLPYADLVSYISKENTDVLLIAGAGDIDLLVEPISKKLA